MAQEKAVGEVKKASKWILRSGVITVFLIALAGLLTQWQDGQIDVEKLWIGLAVLIINAVVNLLDYYRHEATK